MRPRAILFDLDDTLNHRAGSICVMAEAFLRQFGPRLGPLTREEFIALVVRFDGFGYRPRQEFFADLIAALPWKGPAAASAVEAFWQETFPRCCQPAADLRHVLDTLKARGLRLGVVTNGRCQFQNLKIDTLGIRQDLAAIVISEEAGVAKPEPRIFQIALERMGTTAAETWFVGDHPINDAAAARSLGMTAVFFENCHPWPAALPRAKYTIRRLAELLGLSA